MPPIPTAASAAEESVEDLALSLEDFSFDKAASEQPFSCSQTSKPIEQYASEPRRSPRNNVGSQRPKINFEAFASQIRLEIYQENRLRFLQDRHTSIRTAIALSARLHRIGTSIQDGLVDISRRDDKAGFVHVYHTVGDLKDNFYNHWKRHVHLSDPVVQQASHGRFKDSGTMCFYPRLSERSRAELLELIQLLRNDPNFLVERFKALSTSQILALNTRPKYQAIYGSGSSSSSRARNQPSQNKGNVIYSNALKDFALSFERSDPISSLIFNVYGVSADPDSVERTLCLDTWSTVCAKLFSESENDYHPLFNEILNSFASLHEWRAKQRLELFLMDQLQASAFLLEIPNHSLDPQDPEGGCLDPLGTHDATRFFDDAVHRLFEILNDQDGGLPYGALHFGSAVLGKLDPAHQMTFRGYLLHTWFFSEFLRMAMTCPEVSSAREASTQAPLTYLRTKGCCCIVM